MGNFLKNILQIGYVLNDKWVIIEFVGKGAMGEVYRAHQLNLKRDVAIKVISQEMLQSFEEDPEEIQTAIQRFRREVQAMARVRHHNVLQIFDYGSEIIQMKLPPSGSAVPLTPETATPKVPEPFILNKDGMTLHFIPGGELMTESKDTEDAGQTVQIASFYMDEKMVTNHHFADFLSESGSYKMIQARKTFMGLDLKRIFPIQAWWWQHPNIPGNNLKTSGIHGKLLQT